MSGLHVAMQGSKLPSPLYGCARDPPIACLDFDRDGIGVAGSMHAKHPPASG